MVGLHIPQAPKARAFRLWAGPCHHYTHFRVSTAYSESAPAQKRVIYEGDIGNIDHVGNLSDL